MFCDKCGASVTGTTKFCPSCGNPLPVAVDPAYLPPVNAQAQQQESGKKKGGGFWSSGAGIALVVILGLAVIAGITLGVIFLVKMGGNNSVDAATVDVWDEYEQILEDDGTDLAQINMDPNALTKDQEELKKTQERVAALEKVLAKSGGTEQRRQNPNANPANTRDIKAEQMAAALAAYQEYVKMVDTFIGVLVGAITGNQLFNPAVVNNLNGILAELQKLAKSVKDLSDKFLKDNGKIIVDDFNPPVLMFAKEITPQVEQKVAEAQAAEAARIQAEQAAAAAAAAEAQRQAEAAAAAAAAAAEEEAEEAPWTCGDPNCPI